MKLNKNERWYDKDPQLKTIMKFLEKAPEDIKVDVAMDLMQLIIQEDYTDPEGLIEFAKSNYIGNAERWYDADDVVHTAIEMLKLVKEHDRQLIIKEIAETIMFFVAQSGKEHERLVTGNRYLPNK